MQTHIDLGGASCSEQKLFARFKGLIVVVPLLLTSCDQFSGGGWIPSATVVGGKATFGFSGKCRDTQQNGMPVALVYNGELEWHDGEVAFHAVIEPTSVFGQTCADFHSLGLPFASFQGTYYPQPSGEPGRFFAAVQDNGEPGTINGDSISMQLSGGAYNGYFNGGNIQGGNIQVK